MRFALNSMLSCAVLVGLATPVSFASPPQLVNAQGVLQNDAGIPIDDGGHAIKFSLWTAAVGGTSLWSEIDEVTTASGTFNVLLGGASPLPSGDTLASAPELWLEVEVVGDKALPRQRIVSVAFAIEAQHAALADTAGNLDCIGCVAAQAVGFDHSQLAGLAQDDHTQYLPLSGVRAMAGSLDLGGHPALNLVVQNAAAASPPAAPVAGQLWFNTTLGKLMVHDGAAWMPVGTGDAANVVCDGCVDSSDVAFEYAGSATKGGPATSALSADTAIGLACSGCVDPTELDQTAEYTMAGLTVTGPVLKHGTYDVCDSSGNCGKALPTGCSAGQTTTWDGGKWICADLVAVKPPKCDGIDQALGWNGTAYICVDTSKTGPTHGAANGFELVDFWGAVWDGFSRVANTWSDAASVCTTLGGRLPTASEVYRNNATSGSGALGDISQSGYLWTRTNREGTSHITIRVSDGSTSNKADSGSLQYRCIWPDYTSDSFDGDYCNGPAGNGCYAKTGGLLGIDLQDRPALPLWSAIDECAFYNARIPDLRELEEAVRQGLPNGNGRIWSMERYVAANSGPPMVTYQWSGTQTGFTPSNSWGTPGYGGNWPTDSLPFRCIGVKNRDGLKAASGTGFEHPTLKFKISATDSGPGTYWAALDSCRTGGGLMPDLGEFDTAIRAGLGQGTLTRVWTGEHYVAGNSGPPIVTVTWSGTNLSWYPANAFQNGAGYGGEWQSTTTINNRCISYPTKALTDPTCNGGCFKISNGDQTWWVDKADRAGTYWQGLDACVAAGGHVPNLHEMQTLIRAGLPDGSNKAVFTSEKYVGGNPGPPQITVYWSGTNPAWAAPNNFTSPNGHGGNWPTDSLQYRCVWTNAVN